MDFSAGSKIRVYLVLSQAWPAHSQSYQTQRQHIKLHSACIQDEYPAGYVQVMFQCPPGQSIDK